MAQVVTEKVLVEVSRLAKNGESLTEIVNSELTKLLEEVIQEMVPQGAIVEVRAEQS
jgi:hypothetical protein